MHTIICLLQTPLCSPDVPGCSRAGGPIHLQTRPPDLTLPFIPHAPSVFLHALNPYSTHSLFLCACTRSQGQAVRKAGGLVCGTVLISTGIWRRKARYLTPQTPHPSPSSLPLCISGGCFHHTTCIARFGCPCQLSFSWKAASLFPYLPTVVISSFIHISDYPPPPVYLLMNSVSWVHFCFPVLSQGASVCCFFFLFFF